MLAGVDSLGAGAGWSLGLCHKDSHPPDNIMEWAVLGQVLAGHWGCVIRTAIPLTTWSGAVLEQVLAGVDSLGAGAGWSLGLCHKDSHPPDNIMEWAVLGQVLAGHGGCVTRTAIRLTTSWSGAVLGQVLAGHWGCVIRTAIPLTTSWSGQSWGRCWLDIGAVS